jgi:hypothetical protein
VVWLALNVAEKAPDENDKNPGYMACRIDRMGDSKSDTPDC